MHITMKSLIKIEYNMKQIKLLLLAILIIGISSNTFAGDKFGIRAGWQSSNLSIGSFNNLNTFYLGVFKEQKIIPFLRFGGGIEYQQSGAEFDANNLLKMHYISIPLYLKLKLGPIYALGGGAPAFKVGETWELEDKHIDYKDLSNLNTFDFPVFAGIGINILILRIEARYYWGTMEIGNSSITKGTKNQYFQLGLGLAI